MDFHVLGPIKVTRDDGERVHLGSANKPWLLLAVLLARAGRAVPMDTLIDTLWEKPPGSARQNLQLYVYRLRTALGTDLLPRIGAGYAITPNGLLDADHFRHLVSAGETAYAQHQIEAAAAMLREALDLWRGPAYEGWTDSDIVAAEAADLERLRLGAVEQWASAEISLGRHTGVIPELTRLAEENPFRESVRVHLMTALYLSGRRTEALEFFHRTRAVLVDQLGVEPGPDLQRLFGTILRAERPHLVMPHVPRQLPTDLAVFTGREDDLARLDSCLAEPGEHGKVVVIAGSAGVGKTALAVRWARQISELFPDGQLYVNLRGFDLRRAPMEPSGVVRKFLDALNVPLKQTTGDPDALAELYRRTTAGARMLVLLDNAHDAEQVHRLLTGSPGSLTIVTSRNQLVDLVTQVGASMVNLAPLPAPEARDMLAARIGKARVTAEPDAVDELIAWCAGLPLAIALVAARASAHPDFPLASLADQTARLDNLRVVFSWSYQSVSEHARRVFRLLSLHPGSDITAQATASLTATPPHRARAALVELDHANLIHEHRPGRYTFHDLLRAYAAECAREEDTPAARAEALRRLLDHYVHTAHAAVRVSTPDRAPLSLDPPCEGVEPESFGTPEQAVAWFNAELPNLLAAAECAAGKGHDHAWRLAWAVRTPCDLKGHWHELEIACRHGLATKDRSGQAHCHRSLGLAFERQGRRKEAEEHYRAACDRFGEVGPADTHAHSLIDLASLLDEEHADVLPVTHQALTIFQRTGNKHGQARALNSIAWSLNSRGEQPAAIDACRRALTIYEELDDPYGLGEAWDTLGRAYQHLGEFAEAITCYQNARELIASCGHRYYESLAYRHLGEAHLAAGNAGEARAAWRLAEDILTELGHQDLDEVKAILHMLDSMQSRER